MIKIEFDEPIAVSSAPPEIRHWGPLQFPFLQGLPDGRIMCSFHVQLDSAA